MLRKIIITGSEGLIGKKLVEALSSFKDIHIIRADKALGIDLSSEEQVDSFMKQNSEANYLINLFAINDHVEEGVSKSSILEISLDSLRNYCEINLVSLFSVCRSFAKNCRSAKSIVNFSSLYGVRSPKKYIYTNEEKHIGYTMTKHGVIGISRHLATHLLPLRVNCLVPGGVAYKQDKTFVQNYSHNAPIGRMMQAEELTGIVNLLCSQNSSYITGAIIPVDGGWTSW